MTALPYLGVSGRAYPHPIRRWQAFCLFRFSVGAGPLWRSAPIPFKPTVRALSSAKDCFLRSQFNRSALVRQLSAWQVAPVDTPRRDVAEQLADWLNVADAITLHSAHRSIPAVTTASGTAVVTDKSDDLNAKYAQVRATLTKSITTRSLGQPTPTATDFPLYHQRYLDQQRRMEMSIEALRAHARQTLSQASPLLARLASLDTVLAQMLGGREQKLLGSVPTLLKERFKNLHKTRASADDDSWLATFEQDFQQTLLAELDLRMQSIAGMIEALALTRREPTTHAHAPHAHE